MYMTKRAYAILSGLCIIGAIVVSVTDGDKATVASLVGLAGTLAGRGSVESEGNHTVEPAKTS